MDKIEEPNKRTSSIETPSCGVSAWYDERLRGLTLYKTRITYAYHHLQESIPKEILQQLYLDAVTQCRAVVNQIPFGKDAVPTSNSEIEDVERLKNLFIHSILQSQQCNWLFITKVKIVCRKAKYIHRVNDPNALVISKHDVRSEEISWYETRFMYNKFEVTATGGYCNNDSINNDVCSFSGKEAPEHMGRDTQFILLSPVVAAKTTSQPKNFRKKSKSNKWMFQSVLFSG
ncbi:hypothetical protein HPULCUR_004546 [Helicostylum pulchrum]|uniref:Uncharacterized protein n=1 Tax=Helicostylum pulchrum TaxID=562976 RepID=A0ABP9XWQ1_9FUNG